MKKWFNRLHMVIHVGVGVMVAVMAGEWTDLPVWQMLPLAVIGSLLPDLDHVVFWFTYGRKTDYSRQVKFYLKTVGLKRAASFCAVNHKSLQGLYSHTWYGVLLVMVGAVGSLKYWPHLSVLFWSMVGHFAFDMVEDVLLLGGLNSNWKGRVIKQASIVYSEEKNER